LKKLANGLMNGKKTEDSRKCSDIFD
jgi:hypothetical protein